MPDLTFISDLDTSKRKSGDLTSITETVSIELKNNGKEELKKIQPSVSNTHMHVQNANDTGQFTPSQFNEKAAST